MNVLLLGPRREGLIEFMTSHGDHVECTEENINGVTDLRERYEFLVSYGYRHILKRNVIEQFHDRIVNLHISYLPWNRGADPNTWSFLEDTPKGVTIHCIDEGIDTGRILAQRRVGFAHDDTLRTSYAKLSAEIERLFCEIWPDIRAGRIAAKPQRGSGSCHRAIDLDRYRSLLPYGWDTPVAGLVGMALEMKSKVPYGC